MQNREYRPLSSNICILFAHHVPETWNRCATVFVFAFRFYFVNLFRQLIGLTMEFQYTFSIDVWTSLIILQKKSLGFRYLLLLSHGIAFVLVFIYCAMKKWSSRLILNKSFVLKLIDSLKTYCRKRKCWHTKKFSSLRNSLRPNHEPLRFSHARFALKFDEKKKYLFRRLIHACIQCIHVAHCKTPKMILSDSSRIRPVHFVHSIPYVWCGFTLSQQRNSFCYK